MVSPRILFDIPDELSTSAIAVGDVTGSGTSQLCTGGRDGVVRLYNISQSETQLLAQHDVTGAILSIKIADANNDGMMELVVGRSVGPGESPGNAGTVQVYRYTESGTLELLAAAAVDKFVTTVVVTDVTGDGKNEIVAGASDSTLRVFKLEPDNNMSEYTQRLLEDMPIAIGTCDVIGDEIDEIVTGNRDGSIRVFKASNGSLEQIEALQLPSPVISVASGDILGDRKMELAIVTHDGSIRVYRNEESKLELFSELENINALSVRIEELNADHMDEVVVATSDFKVAFYNLYMAELTKITEVEIGSKILALAVGDASGDDLKEVLVGVSEKPLQVVQGLYHIIPKFKVTTPTEGGTDLNGRLSVVNVTDIPVQGIAGKVYWFPKNNLEVEPQQLRFDIGPNETKMIDIKLYPREQGSVIVRPIVLMWTDERGIVRQVTTPETAILVDEGMVQAAPAATAPVTIHVDESIVIDDETFPEVEGTGFGAVEPEAKFQISTSSGSEESLKAAEDLLDQLFGGTESATETAIHDVAAEMAEAPPVEAVPTEVAESEVTTPVTPEPDLSPPVEIAGVEVQSNIITEIRARTPKPPRPGADLDSYSYLFKVMIIGEGAVGKTALVNRYTTGQFETDYKTTIGSQFAVKLAHISPPETAYSVGIKVQAWDVAGQARFKAVRKMYYSGAAGVILVFDVTRRRSFQELVKWVEEADDSIGMRVPLLCVGNKIDLPDRAVPSDEAKKWAEDQGFFYMESSAKTGEGVADMFTVLSELMWKDARQGQDG
ncbi:MAG: GTP-binding protein [Candidatus Thorarchaeota archaeon]